MKVLFYVGYPLAWARGGHAIQILETKKSLEKLGVDVCWLHHEDEVRETPPADILHYWTRPPSDMHWDLARKNGLKLAILDYQQSGLLHPHWTWKLRGIASPVVRRILGRGLFGTLGTRIYQAADAVMGVTPYEAEYMIKVFGARPEKTHYVPAGTEEIFLRTDVPPIPDDGLIYLGYICERKNSVAVARSAKEVGVPVTFIGGALHGEADPYFQEFRKLVDGRVVKWVGEVRDRSHLAARLRGCKGMVLASQNEASPLSVLEALACKTPVMVSNLPNLRVYYRDAVAYCHQPHQPEFLADLRSFYDQCLSGLQQRFEVLSWDEVARRMLGIYSAILTSTAPSTAD